MASDLVGSGGGAVGSGEPSSRHRLFALTLYVIGDDQKQMCLFATFGALTTAVFTDFGGNRRDILRAHAGLAATAALVLTIGTSVNGIIWLAALVTIPVAFAVSFSSRA